MFLINWTLKPLCENDEVKAASVNSTKINFFMIVMF
jgi:hypothetical protein